MEGGRYYMLRKVGGRKHVGAWLNVIKRCKSHFPLSLSIWLLCIVWLLLLGRVDRELTVSINVDSRVSCENEIFAIASVYLYSFLRSGKCKLVLFMTHALHNNSRQCSPACGQQLLYTFSFYFFEQVKSILPVGHKCSLILNKELLGERTF